MSQDPATGVRVRIGQLSGTLKQDLAELASREYPSESPVKFIEFLDGLVQALEKAVESGANVDTAKLISMFLKELASHVRFVETSTYPNIPWALIRPIEKLVGALLPDTGFVFRSKWTYNYTIQRITEFYERSLSQIPHHLFDSTSFFSNHAQWSIVSLPRVDRDNVLLHTILGHEAGHPIADRYLAAEDQTKVQLELQHMVGDGAWARSDIASLPPLQQLNIKRQIFQALETMRSRAIQELGSDLVGYFLFGPSFLFAIHEALLDSALDGAPVAPQCYPPNRYRYRTVVNELQASGFGKLIESLTEGPVEGAIKHAYDSWIADLQDLVAVDTDQEVIENDPLAKRAYELVQQAMPSVRDFVAKEVGALGYERICSEDKLRRLIESISLGVPPAGGPDDAVDFRDSILAGWLYGTADIPVPYDENREAEPRDASALQRLVHKAIEYCELQESYGR